MNTPTTRRNGGYFEWLKRDGKVVQAKLGTGRVETIPLAGFPLGYKSMNTHIHLLESFAQLYEVWPDETLRGRLAELLAVVRDKDLRRTGSDESLLHN